jgi:DNA-binding response OmpR family regulator
MKTRISLVENDSSLRGLLKTLLELEGFEVFPFEEGSGDFTENIKHIHPHFILMDYHLQNSTGIELLRLLRKEVLSPRPKILVLSGEDYKTECLDAGADGFILKPFMPGEIINWLHERENTIDIQEN